MTGRGGHSFFVDEMKAVQYIIIVGVVP